MKVAMLVPPRDFRDETLSHLQMWMSKKDIEGVVVGYNLKECRGYHGATVKPAAEAKELDPGAYEVLLLVDGPGFDSLKLYEYRPLIDLIRIFHSNKRIVVAVGNAIKAIAKANIVRDTKIASSDDETKKIVELFRGIPTEDDIAFDKDVLTISGSDKIPDLVEVLEQKSKGA